MGATLVVMAAGMGSRFGGLKQQQAVTSDGKVLVDFSVFDAVRIGFDHVVFVIRPEMELDFKRLVGDRIAQHVRVDYAFQTSDDLPQGRKKPFGTGQAVLCAKPFVQQPFAVVNSDDYYGRHAFVDIYKHLHGAQNGRYAMVAYRLSRTLSKNGVVSRGACVVRDGYLVDVQECYNVDANGNCLCNGQPRLLPLDMPVSMNLWGMTLDFFDALQQGYDKFLSNADLNKDEFLLQSVISDLIADKKADVRVFENEDRWFGVTYKDDLAEVQSQIEKLIRDGFYDGIW